MGNQYRATLAQAQLGGVGSVAMVDGPTALAMLGQLMENLHGVVVDDDREFLRGLQLSLDLGAPLDQASADRVARIYQQFRQNWGGI